MVLKFTMTTPGDQPHQGKLFYQPLKIQSGRSYSASFRAKADKPQTVWFEVAMNHDPWKKVGLGKEISLTTEWQEFKSDFKGDADDANVRFSFTGFGKTTGTFWFTDGSLRVKTSGTPQAAPVSTGGSAAPVVVPTSNPVATPTAAVDFTQTGKITGVDKPNRTVTVLVEKTGVQETYGVSRNTKITINGGEASLSDIRTICG